AGLTDKQSGANTAPTEVFDHDAAAADAARATRGAYDSPVTSEEAAQTEQTPQVKPGQKRPTKQEQEIAAAKRAAGIEESGHQAAAPSSSGAASTPRATSTPEAPAPATDLPVRSEQLELSG